MATRNRKDLICLSLGAENIAALKNEAAKEGLPVSALVRTLTEELVSKGADNE